MSGNFRVAEQISENAKRDALFSVSICFLITLFFAFVLAGADDPYPNAALVLLCLSLTTGFYVFFAAIEMTLARHLVDLKATLAFWVAVIALLGYIGKIRAGDDINAIFHQDANLFPLTVIATTLLHVAHLLLIPIVIAIGLVIATFLASRKTINQFNSIQRDGSPLLRTFRLL